ncbi:hypothetical protein [Streptomyces boluensis]|uniref:Uncharacterized protein n=1 Tax=Streptomyces boluensis TaxID=1775135 RepID=A0A964UQZ2_9ACTN|nr:hypothetical protein [Streptomyces boluensis]NBE52820.1 hypothetical protein [Streptomyces boluensis]
MGKGQRSADRSRQAPEAPEGERAGRTRRQEHATADERGRRRHGRDDELS